VYVGKKMKIKLDEEGRKASYGIDVRHRVESIEKRM